MVKITKKWANLVYLFYFISILKVLQHLGKFQSQFSLITWLCSCFFPDLISTQLQKIQMRLFFLVGGSKWIGRPVYRFLFSLLFRCASLIWRRFQQVRWRQLWKKLDRFENENIFQMKQLFSGKNWNNKYNNNKW